MLLTNKIHLSNSRQNVSRIHLACKLYGGLVTRVTKLDRTARQIALYRQNRFIHYTVLHEKTIASCRMAFRNKGKKKCLIFCMSSSKILRTQWKNLLYLNKLCTRQGSLHFFSLRHGSTTACAQFQFHMSRTTSSMSARGHSGDGVWQ